MKIPKPAFKACNYHKMYNSHAEAFQHVADSDVHAALRLEKVLFAMQGVWLMFCHFLYLIYIFSNGLRLPGDREEEGTINYIDVDAMDNHLTEEED